MMSIPPGESSSIVALTLGESLYAATPATLTLSAVRLASCSMLARPLTLSTRTGGKSPGRRKVKVNVASEWPSPPRWT